MSRLDRYRSLLLDSGCRPLCAIPWERAILLDMSDKVDVMEYYDEVVRSPTAEYPLPAVVRLRQYLRVRARPVALTRRNLILRDGCTCQYCGGRPPLRDLTMDHVVPRSRGGDTSWENVVLACGTCNRAKGARTPREAGLPLAAPPRVPGFLPTTRRALAVADPPEQWLAWLPAA
jgi:5-methylcytosine-specific restriction endonuclease McrA